MCMLMALHGDLASIADGIGYYEIKLLKYPYKNIYIT